MSTKGPVLWMVRLLLVSRIVIVLLALGFVLVIWQRNTKKLIRSVEKLSSENPNIDRLERGITNLYQAENNFRFYSATYNKKYFAAYKANLSLVSAIIDSIQLSVNNEAGSKIDISLNEKANLSNVVIKLKILTDSLLFTASQWDSSNLHKVQVPLFDIKKIENLTRRSIIDSIFDTTKVEKKGFFEKVQSLFKDEPPPQKKVITVKRTEEIQDTTFETTSISSPEFKLLKEIQDYYGDKINQYSDGRSRLNNNEKELASINDKLIAEIASLLFQLKQSEIKLSNELKEAAFKTGENSARSISIIAVSSILIAALFFFLIIYYLGKIKTSSIQLENEKQKAETLALQRGRFLSNISHEIRAPLNNILGFTEQLRHSPGEHTERYLAGIGSSAEIMLTTINQILDLSKLEAGEMVYNKDVFSPYKAIEKAGGLMIQRAKEKKLMLNLHLPLKDDIYVMGDSFRLTQVIINLIDNAIKYTDKGEINVFANIKAENEEYVTYIEVTDTGIGIPPEKVEDIFSEFERLEEEDIRRWKPGTGLGLPIAQKVIEQQGGRLYVKSTSPKGTVFAIEIAYPKPESGKPAPSKPVKTEKFPAGKTILVTTDDELSNLLITAMLKNQDINILTTKNGREALEMVNNNKIDLILTDIAMPELSGSGFIRKLRANPLSAGIPVIAISANVLADDIKHIEKEGFNSIIFKPFKQNELLEKIWQYLK